ncbi:MAG TPA: flagellar basal body P-ring protein FlgI [Acidobacteriaceae bacterium]|nr:flagellar basal body P-ring protein FlgI [Acidobacteriaceae bacterium]
MIIRIAQTLTRVTSAVALSSLLILTPALRADDMTHAVLVRDITSVQGVRDNMLVGYGLVVGLHQTGDSQQTYFTVQTLANAMQRMGVLITPSVVEVKNVAAVFVTASLPPFARPGERLDVTVSSVGDAKSLEGGVLLMSALHGPDGQVYAEAQGPLQMGGYTVGNGFNGKQVNSTTVGMVSNGGIVERDTAVDLSDFKTVSLLLHNPDFTTANEIASVVNQNFHKKIASALDNTRIDINVAQAGAPSVPILISEIQSLSLVVHTPARIVINERTGTIVLGGDVKLTPVSVIHGNLSIEVSTTYTVAPVPGSGFPGWPGGPYGPGGQEQRAQGQGQGQGQPGKGQPNQGQQGQGQPSQPNQGQPNQGQPGQGQQGPGQQGPGQQGFGGAGNQVLPGQQAALVPQTTYSVTDQPAQTMRLDSGANVQELVNGLHAIGTTARDVVAILQAIKAEGGIQADVEVQ